MARQKFGATCVTVTRISSAIQGTDSVTVVMASTCCCRARLWRTCQTSTGGVSRIARVRNTAVPGTWGTRSCFNLAMKVPSGMRVSWMRSVMPDVRHRVHGAGEQQRNVTAFHDLQGVGDEERGIDKIPATPMLAGRL